MWAADLFSRWKEGNLLHVRLILLCAGGCNLTATRESHLLADLDDLRTKNERALSNYSKAFSYGVIFLVHGRVQMEPPLLPVRRADISRPIRLLPSLSRARDGHNTGSCWDREATATQKVRACDHANYRKHINHGLNFVAEETKRIVKPIDSRPFARRW